MNVREAQAARIIAQVRAHGTGIKPDGELYGRRVYVESGHVVASIAGAKTHSVKYVIYRWADDKTGELGPEELSMTPACGTIRSHRGGGHYTNYYGIKAVGTTPTCAKCGS
jgi:hypothetical protein